MLLKEEINKYLNYCKFQKELDDKTSLGTDKGKT